MRSIESIIGPSTPFNVSDVMTCVLMASCTKTYMQTVQQLRPYYIKWHCQVSNPTTIRARAWGDIDDEHGNPERKLFWTEDIPLSQANLHEFEIEELLRAGGHKNHGIN